MKASFIVCVAGEDKSTHSAFQDAFASFFLAIKKLLAQGTSWQVLETGCWIEGVFETEGKPPVRSAMIFYDARDFAYSTGVLVTSEKDGKAILANPMPSISTDVAFDQYLHVAFECARNSLVDFAEQIKAAAAATEDLRIESVESADAVESPAPNA